MTPPPRILAISHAPLPLFRLRTPPMLPISPLELTGEKGGTRRSAGLCPAGGDVEPFAPGLLLAPLLIAALFRLARVGRGCLPA